MTSERITALDFTPSFMTLGVAILYEKPTVKPPSTFSFMSPFSKEVWVFLGLSYLTVSLCFFCLGRICRSQWENPYPCIEEPEFLENQFSLQNSMWFAIGELYIYVKTYEKLSLNLEILLFCCNRCVVTAGNHSDR